MPIFLEPDKKFDVVLSADRDKPADKRPTFMVRSQSMRGHQEIAEVLDKLHESEATVESLFELTSAKLAEVVTGWRNMGDVKPATDFRDFLTYQEARELLMLVMHNQYVTPDEKKS